MENNGPEVVSDQIHSDWNRRLSKSPHRLDRALPMTQDTYSLSSHHFVTKIPTDIIQRIISLNEKELKTWIDTIQSQLYEKEKDYNELLERYKSLQDCFQYNLGLIAGRDEELNHLEDEIATLSETLHDRSQKLSELEKRTEEQSNQIVKLQRLLQENELEYQDTLKSLHRQRQSAMDEKDLEMKKLQDNLEQQKTQVYLELKDASLKLEAQRAIWEEEMGSLKKMHEQDTNALKETAKLELQSCERRISSLTEQLTATKSLQAEAQTRIDSILAEEQNLKAQIKELESEMSDANRLAASRILQLENELTQAKQLREHESSNHEVQLKHLKQQLESIERVHLTEREGLQSQLASLREKLHITDKLTEDVQKSNAEQFLKNRELLSEYEVSIKMKDRELNSLTAQIMNLQNELVSRSNELDDAKKKESELLGMNLKLSEQLKRKDEQFLDMSHLQDETMRDAQLWQETAATLEHDFSEQQSRLLLVEKENNRLLKDIEVLRQQLDDMKLKEKEHMSIIRENTNHALDPMTKRLENENNQLKLVIQQMRKDMEELSASVYPGPVLAPNQNLYPDHSHQAYTRPQSNLDVYHDDATQMHQHVSHLQQLLQQKQVLVDRLMKAQASLHKKLDSINLQGMKSAGAESRIDSIYTHDEQIDARIKQYKHLAQNLKLENKQLKHKISQIQEEWVSAIRERDDIIELSNQMKAELDFLLEENENRKESSTQTLSSDSSSKQGINGIPVPSKTRSNVRAMQKQLPPAKLGPVKNAVEAVGIDISPTKSTQSASRSKPMDTIDAIKMLRSKGIRNWNDKTDLA